MKMPATQIKAMTLFELIFISKVYLKLKINISAE